MHGLSVSERALLHACAVYHVGHGEDKSEHTHFTPACLAPPDSEAVGPHKACHGIEVLPEAFKTVIPLVPSWHSMADAQLSRPWADSVPETTSQQLAKETNKLTVGNCRRLHA